MAETSVPHNGADGKGSVLALDLGTTAGWALRQADGTITSGTVEFRPGRFEGGGMRYLRFKRWLNEMKQYGVDTIVFEEVRNHKGVDAAHVYGGFMATMTGWAEQNEIPYRGIPVGTIKRYATGKGNASKAEVMEAMRRKGHSPVDDNAADALAILHYAIDEEVMP
ncbi:MAG: hypothetical protein HQL77_17885 [Magnetococcales bacterium]|nr:hypothetical protein [Magnetococcales bacterium]